jgi:hypothetical protein
MKTLKVSVVIFCFINLIYVYKSQACNSSINPTSSLDCLKNGDNSTNYCCMLNSPGFNPTSRSCLQLPVSSYYGQNIYNYNNLTWNLNCGNPTVTPVTGGLCGNQNPNFAYDCWQFSNRDSSCCLFYSGNLTGTPGCQWLGTKKTGNTTSPATGYLLNCSASYLGLQILVLVLASLILF